MLIRAVHSDERIYVARPSRGGNLQENHGLWVVNALLDGVRQPLPTTHHGVHVAAAQLAEEGLKLR